MPALCLMLSGTYYAKNYAGIIGRGLVSLAPLYVLLRVYMLTEATPDCNSEKLFI